MANPRNWVLGKHLTALNIQPGTRNADGSITWGTASSLLRYASYVRVSNETVLDMITSVDASQAHYESIMEDFTLSVGEILAKVATGTNAWTPVIPGFGAAYSFFKVTFTRGGQTYTFQGTKRSFSDGISNPGANLAELVLAPIDDGTNAALVLN